jgi:hypothetical protein
MVKAREIQVKWVTGQIEYHRQRANDLRRYGRYEEAKEHERKLSRLAYVHNLEVK